VRFVVRLNHRLDLAGLMSVSVAITSKLAH
jgi:hypothetical protein